MSTETTNKKIKIDNGTTFGKTYTDKAIDAKLPTDLIASANKLSLGVGNAPLGNGVNLDGFTYDEATKTLKVSGGESIPIIEGSLNEDYTTVTLASAPSANFILHIASLDAYIYMSSAVNIYYGSLITGEPDGGITIMAFASKEDSPTILNLTQSTFNPNNIPDIHINPNNLINMVITDGVDNIDFSNELKTKFLCVLDTKSMPYKIYPLYYTSENHYQGFSMFMYNNMTFLETYTLSITNNIGTITTVTGGFKTHQLFDTYSILVPKDTPDANILPLPADASTSTYVLKAVNGTVQWVKE